jgi:hypothetical protein
MRLLDPPTLSAAPSLSRSIWAFAHEAGIVTAPSVEWQRKKRTKRCAEAQTRISTGYKLSKIMSMYYRYPSTSGLLELSTALKRSWALAPHLLALS